MRMRVLLGILGLLLSASALAGPADAIFIPACGTDFVIVGQNEIDLEQGPTEIFGNLIVASSTGTIEVGRFNIIHGTVSANTLRLGNDAQVDVCQANNFQGVDPTTVCGSIIPLPLPTCVPNTLFNPVVVDPCVDSATNLTIPANTTATLPPNSCVGLLRINDGATVNASGTSNIRALIMGNSAKLLGPATINIKNGFSSEPKITTDSIIFNVGGTANNTINPGNSSLFINTLFNVPAGGIHIRFNSSFQGDTEIVSRRATIQPLTTGDVCRLQVAKECTVVGAAPPFTVNFAGSVTNTGTTAVNTLNVVNNQPAPNTALACLVAGVPVTSLAPGGTCTFSGSYVPPVQTPPFSDTVTATAATAAGATCTASDTATCSPGAGNGNCPEDDDANAGGSRECTRCVIVNDPNNFCAGKPKHATWQAAIAAAAAGDVICVYTNTKENVTIAGPANLTITQCTTAKVTASDFTKPVVTIKSTAVNTLIIGPDTIGGTIGWCLEPGASGHELRGVRASDATRCGILDRGGQNEISFNSVSGVVPGAGVCIAATQSTIRGGRVEDNSIGVVFDSATSSIFENARVEDNGPTAPVGATAGIVVRANSNGNTVRNNRCDGNAPSDPDIANLGVGTILSNNQCQLPPPAGVNPNFVMPANCN